MADTQSVGTPLDTAATVGGNGTVIAQLKRLNVGVDTLGGGGGELTYTDRSGSITSGGTAQVLAAANPSRAAFTVQNLSSGSLYLCWTGTATDNSSTPNSLELLPNAIYVETSPLSRAAISVIGATTGQKWYAVEGT